MGRSRAELQKAYRQRKKRDEGEAYLKKERERVKKYYVPAAACSRTKLKARNEANKLRNRLSRFKKKARDDAANAEAEVTDSGYGTSNVNDPEPDESQAPRLVVRLPITRNETGTTPSTSGLCNINPGRSRGPRKRNKRMISRARKTIKNLENETRQLKRKLNTKSTQLWRQQEKLRKIASPEPGTPLTPNKQTERDLDGIDLTPRRKSTVRRKLLLANVFTAELRRLRKSISKKQRAPLHRIAAGRIVRKYKCTSHLANAMGVARCAVAKIGQSKQAVFSHNIERRIRVCERYRVQVHEFLMREDNSRQQPGKQDAVKVGSEKKQAYVLTDYMKNLHVKFLSENPEINLSFSSFCRMRPSNVLLVRFISRNSCLCIRHENMAHKMTALRAYGVQVNKNPESIIDIDSDSLYQLMAPIAVDQIEYKEWRKVKSDGKDRTVLTTQVMGTNEFREKFVGEAIEFAEHVRRLRTQYREIRSLKQNLKSDEVILQMDFAENFTPRAVDEVQSGYWNQVQITLHPVVVYYKNDTDTDHVQHKSFVVVSDVTSHKASTVAAFIDKIIPEVKQLKPNVTKIHYWTDSPCSQYRNKHIFYVLATHQGLYNIRARWNYFESGHGKGPCDGVGGACKRQADEAIRRGVAIQSAADFFNWAAVGGMKTVKFLFVAKELCDEKEAVFQNEKLKPVPGTMKLHAVAFVPLLNILKIRNTSCYCASCADGFCDSWRTVPFEVRHTTGTTGNRTNPIAMLLS